MSTTSAVSLSAIAMASASAASSSLPSQLQAPVSAQQRKRWVAAPSGPPPVEPVQLERVLGHSCVSSGGAGYNPSQPSEFAYVCGSVLVVFDQRQAVQKRFMRGRRGHELGCLSWSPQGDWLLAGERGANAAVMLWDAKTATKLATIVGHNGSVTLIKLSPLKDYLCIVAEDKTSGLNTDTASRALVLDHCLADSCAAVGVLSVLSCRWLSWFECECVASE